MTPEPGLVLLHLKSLRRNWVTRKAWSGRSRRALGRPGRLRVDLHPECRGPPAATLLGPRGPADVEFAIHPRFSDAGLSAISGRSGDRAAAPLGQPLGLAGAGPGLAPVGRPGLWLLPRSVGRGGELRQHERRAGRVSSPGPSSSTAAADAAAADRSTRLAERAAVRQAHEQIYRRVARSVRGRSAGRR